MINCSITENYFAEKRRMTKRTKTGMCSIRCRDCPLSCGSNGLNEGLSCSNFEMYYPEKAAAIVQKWSDEHPRKTCLTELLEKFPKTPLDDDGTPSAVCPDAVGLTERFDCTHDCVECWNRPLREEEE